MKIQTFLYILYHAHCSFLVQKEGYSVLVGTNVGTIKLLSAAVMTTAWS